MTTKSAVVDRLSSGLGQLVNVVNVVKVVSAQLPEHRDHHSVQHGDARTPCQGQDGVRRSPDWRGSVAMSDSGIGPSDADLVEEESMPFEAPRATFPPGKRHPSVCIRDTTAVHDDLLRECIHCGVLHTVVLDDR